MITFKRFRTISLRPTARLWLGRTSPKIRHQEAPPARGPFAAWIFTIARNAINKHLRARRLRRWISLDTVAHQPLPDALSVEEIAIWNEQRARLMPLLAELDQRQRDLLALKFGAGLTNRRIAELTGLTESNVGVILYRTLHHLREKLREEDGYEEEHEP